MPINTSLVTSLFIACLFIHGSVGRSDASDVPPQVTLHLSFEKDNWVKSAAGCADCFCAMANPVEGRVGEAALIENVNQSAAVDSPFNLSKARGTVTLWYKPTVSAGKKAYYPLLWCGENHGVGGGAFWLWRYDSSLRFDVRDPQDRYCTAGTSDWKPDQWVHIAAVWDCGKGLSLWVNGQKKAERETTWKPEGLAPLLIGTGNAPCEGRAAGGALDELKVFDRPLTAEEIQADFAGSLALTPAPVATPEQLAAARKAPPVREREPLETLFHLTFDDGFAAAAARGAKEPTNANRPALVPGVSGRAAQFGPRQSLRYLEDKNLRKECGALSVWVQTPVDGNDAKEWLHIFREEGPNKAGANALWLWLFPQHGLRWDPRDKEDSHVLLAVSSTWKKGEWHHVIACWDALRGTAVYVDGKLRSFGSAGDSGKKFIPISWDPVAYSAFIVGADAVEGHRPWQGAIDEFKIFSRPLTDEEARAEYGRFCTVPVEVIVLDPYLWAGEKETLTLSFDNLKGAPAQMRAQYTVRDAADNAVAQGDLGSLAMVADKRLHLPLKLSLPKKGAYTLTVTVKAGDDARDFVSQMYALDRAEPAQDAKRALVSVAEIDAAALPSVVESAPSRVVDSPLGKYREAGVGRNDRFALTFQVAEPHAPHVAVVTYPDDKPRTMEVMLQPLDVRHDYQAQTGVFTGDEYPLSQAMQEQKIVFWPQGTNMSFVFMTVEKDRPAAVKSLKVYKLDGGFPRLAVKPFAGSVPAREIGLYHEDPVFADCYGSLPGNPDMHFFPQFETVIDRMLDYHQSFGMSTVHYPVSWYHGPLFGSEAEPLTDFGGRPHPDGFPKYLLRRLAARGMTFNAWLHLHQIDSLLPYTITDDDRVRAGEETVINMRFDNRLFYRAWHGRDPVYNPLDPHVQAAVKRQFAEFVDRYGGEPALTGVTLNTVRHSLFAFGSLDSGYNDVNLARFQKETGIKIPVDGKDRFRFAKSYQWLMANAQDPWIQWRCRQLHDYYKELAGLLRAKRPDLTLGVVIFAAESAKATADYLNPAKRVLQEAREQGLDPALYVNDPEIVFRYSMVPADLRWRRAHGATGSDVYDTRTVDSAPEMVAPLALTPSASVNMHDRYFEDAVARTAPLKGLSAKAQECDWRVSALNGNTVHGLENHVFALNNLDALTITKGGFLVGTFGIEDKVGRFAKAFRALPAVKFEDVPGLADPVRVRQKSVDGANYVYVLNRLPYPVEAALAFSGAEAVDLVNGEKSSGGKLSLKLRPYDLRVFRQADAGGRVTGGAATVGQDVVDGLAKQVAAADAALRDTSAKGGDLAAVKPYLAKAKACLADKEYARLHFLLQEAWAYKLK
ncbi:MAG TPA: Beta-galactosidase C-terminal domain [Kiritimatiellia bacterium]|nr:Beta-galactosidase C-terminal domain [Kiritimatiellia bacterium]